MTVSVIICTRNRADSLRQTLASIGTVSVPADWDVEIVVVDNGSHDHTSEVVYEARLENLKVRYVSEPRPGKALALNTGLAQSEGDVIIFTDDDVRVSSNWIERMGYPLALGHADAVVGRVVFPEHVERALSATVLRDRRSWFASTDEIDAQRPHRMVGANMGLHRRVLTKVPGFEVELGPGALGFYDDTLFSEQIQEASFRLVAAFDVSVEHHFDVSRLTEESLRGICRRMGRSHAFVFHHWRHQRSRLAFPRWLLSELSGAWYSSRRSLSLSSARKLTLQELKSEHNRAFYREYLAQRRLPPKYQRHNRTSPIASTQLATAGNSPT